MKLPKLLLILAVLGLSVVAVTAQTTANTSQPRMVTQAEIDKLRVGAITQLNKISYRRKTTRYEYEEGEKTPRGIWTTTLEILRPDRKRKISDSHNGFWGDGYSEYIEIGKKTYYKEDEEPWKVSKEKQYVGDPISLLLEKPFGKWSRIELEYLYLGKQDINGSVADLYQITSKFYRDELNVLSVQKMWFDNKGRYVKNLIESTQYSSGLTMLLLSEYEYDKPIKIEAPIK